MNLLKQKQNYCCVHIIMDLNVVLERTNHESE